MAVSFNLKRTIRDKMISTFGVFSHRTCWLWKHEKGATRFQLKLCERATFSVKLVSQQVKGLVLGAKPPCIKL